MCPIGTGQQNARKNTAPEKESSSLQSFGKRALITQSLS
jgi:hypothetical protein